MPEMQKRLAFIMKEHMSKFDCTFMIATIWIPNCIILEEMLPLINFRNLLIFLTGVARKQKDCLLFVENKSERKRFLRGQEEIVVYHYLL